MSLEETHRGETEKGEAMWRASEDGSDGATFKDAWGPGRRKRQEGLLLFIKMSKVTSGLRIGFVWF